jgi:hypothetical protein
MVFAGFTCFSIEQLMPKISYTQLKKIHNIFKGVLSSTIDTKHHQIGSFLSLEKQPA